MLDLRTGLVFIGSVSGRCGGVDPGREPGGVQFFLGRGRDDKRKDWLPVT